MRRLACVWAVMAVGCSSSGDAGTSAADSGSPGVDDASTRTSDAGDGSTPPSDGAIPSSDAAKTTDSGAGVCAIGRGFPAGAPWVSFYGSSTGVDFAKVASTFRIVNVDVDPGVGNFTDPQIEAMRAGGNGCNRVISYMNVGACESFRDYYQTPPAGHASCVSSGALTSAYDGYPDEKWADLSNVAYRDLIVNYVAPRLAARGIDGFFLDNMEVVEHGPSDANGPCSAACRQGGLDLVWELRQRFPDKLIVMQNATSDVTRLGTTHGVAYPSLLDGVSHEEVYTGAGANDPGARTEMLAWLGMHMVVNGRPFWLADEDYVGACSAAAKPQAEAVMSKATADGLSPYVTDASGMQSAPCYWNDFP